MQSNDDQNRQHQKQRLGCPEDRKSSGKVISASGLRPSEHVSHATNRLMWSPLESPSFRRTCSRAYINAATNGMNFRSAARHFNRRASLPVPLPAAGFWQIEPD
jgi:hypothetical protein